MKIISPRRMLFVVLMIFASMGKTADAQDLGGILDFLSTFDFGGLFESLCPVVAPLLESFGIPLSVCDASGTDDDGTDDDEGTDDEPEPAPTPTKKGKVVVGTAAPVPPSATP